MTDPEAAPPSFYPVSLDVTGRPASWSVAARSPPARSADCWSAAPGSRWWPRRSAPEIDALDRPAGRRSSAAPTPAARPPPSASSSPRPAPRGRRRRPPTPRPPGSGSTAPTTAAHCSFFLPSVHRDGPVSVAVSTGGASPALASWLRDRLAAECGDRLARWPSFSVRRGSRLQHAGVGGPIRSTGSPCSTDRSSTLVQRRRLGQRTGNCGGGDERLVLSALPTAPGHADICCCTEVALKVPLCCDDGDDGRRGSAAVGTHLPLIRGAWGGRYGAHASVHLFRGGNMSWSIAGVNGAITHAAGGRATWSVPWDLVGAARRTVAVVLVTLLLAAVGDRLRAERCRSCRHGLPVRAGLRVGRVSHVNVYDPRSGNLSTR